MKTSRFIDEVPGDPLQDLMDHLLTAPLTAWLDVMRRADPAEHYRLITWILEQPECDGTIALVGFYRADAAEYLRRGLTIVADHPTRNAIPAIIAAACAEGRFQTFELGLDHRELDAEMDEMAKLLADTPTEERAFDVPVSFLVAPKAEAFALDPLWSPKYDAETAQLYRAAGLLSTPKDADAVQTGAEDAVPGGLAGMLSRLGAMVRRAPEKTAE